MNRRISFKLSILAALAVFMVTAGLSCKLQSAEERELLEPITLNWWGTYDEASNFAEIIAAYRAVHPNINIKYTKYREAEFEQQLLNALAEDRGPDIVSLNNKDIQQWIEKLQPLPPATRLAYQETQKSLGIKNETIIEVREMPSITTAQLRREFVDVVYNDVVRNGQIWGIPLSVDTLVMMYNRDLFNNAGIALPPTTWSDVQASVRQLTFQDRSGKLVQAGAALGLVSNISTGQDIIALLMMQNGADMITNGTVTFHVLPPNADPTYNPGPEAVRFYTDFAVPTREVYSWNDTFPEAIDAFAQGKVAIIFGYHHQVAEIEAKRQGKLNFEIVPVPQIEGRSEVNIADYWVQSVTRKSKHSNEAWDFIQFMSKAQNAQRYIATTNKPAALRSIVQQQLEDDQLGVFARQLLTAVNWYTGDNNAAVRSAFSEMVQSILIDSLPPQDAAQLAAQKIQQTL